MGAKAGGVLVPAFNAGGLGGLVAVGALAAGVLLTAARLGLTPAAILA